MDEITDHLIAFMNVKTTNCIVGLKVLINSNKIINSLIMTKKIRKTNITDGNQRFLEKHALDLGHVYSECDDVICLLPEHVTVG